MEENKTPVEETVKEAPPTEPADAPAEAKAEAATPESEHKHKAREEKRELAAAKEKAAAEFYLGTLLRDSRLDIRAGAT